MRSKVAPSMPITKTLSLTDGEGFSFSGTVEFIYPSLSKQRSVAKKLL
jgi:hypothetical protein